MAGQGTTSAVLGANRRVVALLIALFLIVAGLVAVGTANAEVAEAAAPSKASAKRVAAKRLAAKRLAAKRLAARKAATRARLAAQARAQALRTPARKTSPKVTSSYSDGDVFGDWRVVFAGYGSVDTYSADTARVRLAPQAVTNSANTSAALAVSNKDFTGPQLAVSATATTTKQLRQGSAANAWEVAWLVWDYVDNEHFYYAIAKPNGWELGKRDPAYPGGQRFLATGSTPAVAVGSAADFNVSRQATESATQMSLTINGSKVASFNDTERPYSHGNVGAYTEDAAVEFARISVNGSALLTK